MLSNSLLKHNIHPVKRDRFMLPVAKKNCEKSRISQHKFKQIFSSTVHTSRQNSSNVRVSMPCGKFSSSQYTLQMTYTNGSLSTCKPEGLRKMEFVGSFEVKCDWNCLVDYALSIPLSVHNSHKIKRSYAILECM